MGRKYRILELYCGIGGMRFALDATGIPFEVVAAIDVNPVVNDTYQHNFGVHGHSQKNILSFTAAELENMRLDIITMSPPCQPFTRVGLKKDNKDARSSSFLHILNILNELQKKPMYLLLENVQGFENSQTRYALIQTLDKCGYTYQEFLLSPQAFGIPNSRLRYYIIAKLKEMPLSFAVSQQLQNSCPFGGMLDNNELLITPENPILHGMPFELLQEMPKVKSYKKFFCSNCCHLNKTEEDNGCPLKHFLETKPSEYFDSYLIPDQILLKYWSVLDIVDENSHNSCCFTKAYYRYAQGTGSVLLPLQELKAADIFELVSKSEDINEQLSLLKQLRLRYFTPKEIANIMCFPSNFDFPSNITVRQMYKSLGNSLNVFVVSSLLQLLFQNQCK